MKIKGRFKIQKLCVEKVVPGKREDQWIFVAWYKPLDKEQIDSQWLNDRFYYAFANDGSGSQYVVDPTRDEAEILYHEHESGELKATGITMAEFLKLEEVKVAPNTNARPVRTGPSTAR